MYKTLTLIFILSISITFGQPQNSVVLSINGVSGSDQTVIRFGMSGTSSFDMGPDVEKVFPTDINNPLIYTTDVDTSVYSINTMNILSIEDTVVPIFVQNSLAGTYQINIADVAPLNPSVLSYVVVPQTNDTIIYDGNETITLNIAQQSDFQINNPFLLFHFGVDFDLNSTTHQVTNTSCTNTDDGELEIDIPFENSLVNIYNDSGDLLDQRYSVAGPNMFNSLQQGVYYVEIKKGLGFLSFETEVLSNNNTDFQINLLNLDYENLTMEVEASNPQYSSLLWSFGDGNTSNQNYNLYTFNSNSEFQIHLNVWSGNCEFNDTLNVDFSTYASLDESEVESSIKFHYSKANGLVAFKEHHMIEEFSIFSLDGKLLLNGNYDFEKLNYFSDQILIKYKLNNSSGWESKLLIGLQ